MLSALVPVDMQHCSTSARVNVVGFEGDVTNVDLTQVGFYIPPYMGPKLTLELIEYMPNLEVVQLLTVGFDSALEHVPDHVTLCNAVGVHDDSTAELAVALILTSLRGLDDYARAMSGGIWLHGRRTSLVDRSAIIIGAGGVGQAIAKRLRPFGVDPTLIGRSQRLGVVPMSELQHLLPNSDIVILAVPLNQETKGLVDDAFLSKMRDGALLVNVARGGVVDTEALVQHLQRGRIRAALDVIDPEPLPPDHPLWKAPGVLISPHVGGDSSAFLPRAQRLVSEQLQRWQSGVPLANVVQR